MGLVMSNYSERGKPFEINHIKYDWEDLIVLIELLTNKKTVFNTYPQKDYAYSSFNLTNKYNKYTSKVCLVCWHEHQYIRFYWKFKDYNFCHRHNVSMVEYDLGQDIVITDDLKKDKSVFLHNFFNKYAKHDFEEVSFNFVEKEIFLYFQDLKLANFFTRFFQIVFSKTLDYEAVVELHRSTELVNKSPENRIKHLLSVLCKGDELLVKQAHHLFIFIYFVDYKYNDKRYDYSYLAQLFRYVGGVNISFYRHYIWEVIFKSKSFLNLIELVGNKHDQLFKLRTYRLPFEGSRENIELDSCNLDCIDVESISEIECFRFLQTKNVNLNTDLLNQVSPVKKYDFSRPDYEEMKTLTNSIVKITEKMLVNVFVKMNKKPIDLPENFWVRNY